MNCLMCGRQSNNLQNRSYVYDNGEQFVAAVCPSCQEIHFNLSIKGNK